MWSIFIGGTGLALPLVVPPLRELVTPTETVVPPSPARVAQALMKGT